MAFGSEKKRGRRKTDYAGWIDDDLLALVEPGLELEGKMSFNSGMVRLNAHYKGEVQCEGLVVVAEQGELEAEIHAKVVSVSGKVKGNIHASERLEIKQDGIVLGEVFTPCLTIEPGGYFDGQCHMPAPASENAAVAEPGSSAF